MRAYKVDCGSAVPPPRRRAGDTIAAFATADSDVHHREAGGRNVSVFISSWDSSLPPQGSAAARMLAPTAPVAVRLAVRAGSGRISAASVIRIDEQHANPRAAYLEMNATWPSAPELERLHAASAVVEEGVAVSPDGASVELAVPPNAAYTVLLRLE